jgi:hypothetical protein
MHGGKLAGPHRPLLLAIQAVRRDEHFVYVQERDEYAIAIRRRRA